MTARAAADRHEAIVHETAQRLRFRIPPAALMAELRVQFERLPGVERVLVSPKIRSVTVRYDGRRRTRKAILGLLERPIDGLGAQVADAAMEQGRPRSKLKPFLPALATAAVPIAPAGARPVVALGALAVRTLTRPAHERRTAGFLLDSLSLATTALTGHPVTTAASILLGTVAETWRDNLLVDTERLLGHLTPPVDPEYVVSRDQSEQRLTAEELRIGDSVALASGQVVPADGLIRSGRARIFPLTPHEDPAGRVVRAGRRLASGQRLVAGSLRYVVERTAARSQARRMREHVRHTLRTRDSPGGLTPDLQRLATLPITAASLVLAITRDAGRMAAMLQADPQHGLQLAHPVAREAALYALARQGTLGNGLETVERLASATVLAVEDIRILTERNWQVAEVRSEREVLRRRDVQRWLARLAGIESVDASNAGFRDRQVADWLEHGAVLHDPPRFLHVAGAEPLRRTWGLELTHADRGSLERVLGIVEAGHLIGSVKLRVKLRPGIGDHLGQLRELGFRRIAILTEDLEERAGHELESLGADVVVSSSREAQGRWLEQVVEEGDRVALLHTGLRALLPPGGLSLCPVEADAGTHAVLLGEPLRSLIAARRVAREIHRRMKRQFGATMAANAVLMVASSLRLIPPIVNTTLHHAATLALLRTSMGLADVAPLEEA